MADRINESKNVFLEGQEVCNPNASPTNVIKVYACVCDCDCSCGVALTGNYTLNGDGTIDIELTGDYSALTLGLVTLEISDQSANTAKFAVDVNNVNLSANYDTSALQAGDDWTIGIYVGATITADNKQCSQREEKVIETPNPLSGGGSF